MCADPHSHCYFSLKCTSVVKLLSVSQDSQGNPQGFKLGLCSHQEHGFPLCDLDITISWLVTRQAWLYFLTYWGTVWKWSDVFQVKVVKFHKWGAKTTCARERERERDKKRESVCVFVYVFGCACACACVCGCACEYMLVHMRVHACVSERERMRAHLYMCECCMCAHARTRVQMCQCMCEWDCLYVCVSTGVCINVHTLLTIQFVQTAETTGHSPLCWWTHHPHTVVMWPSPNGTTAWLQQPSPSHHPLSGVDSMLPSGHAAQPVGCVNTHNLFLLFFSNIILDFFPQLFFISIAVAVSFYLYYYYHYYWCCICLYPSITIFHYECLGY